MINWLDVNDEKKVHGLEMMQDFYFGNIYITTAEHMLLMNAMIVTDNIFENIVPLLKKCNLQATLV